MNVKKKKNTIIREFLFDNHDFYAHQGYEWYLFSTFTIFYTGGQILKAWLRNNRRIKSLKKIS